MKKNILFILLGIVAIITATRANDENVNVLSYYAVGNSLDGQPLIDKINVLRFYPVYAMRDIDGIGETDTVRITIYYGANIATRNAEKMDFGRYWQILLPKFQLGEAIQRIDVETHINLNQTLPIRTYLDLKRSLDKNLFSNIVNQTIGTASKNQSNVEAIANTIKLNDISENVHSLKRSLLTLSTTMTKESYPYPFIETTKRIIESIPCNEQMTIINDSIRKYNDTLRSFVSRMEGYYDIHVKNIGQCELEISQRLDSASKMILSTVSFLDTKGMEAKITEFNTLRDTLNFQIERAMMSTLTDTNTTGLSVRRSDIVLDTNMQYCRILYRNYKTSLRRLVALDPAERIGIFRARYIPFAVTGETFRRPLKDRAQAIFEIGLAFGDQIVSGDDFTLPEFSARRLGVAFAISNKFFSDEADIMAIALTYDFNSFGSIGIGANFPPNRKITEGYFSFGINRRAFEALLVQMQKLFE